MITCIMQFHVSFIAWMPITLDINFLDSSRSYNFVFVDHKNFNILSKVKKELSFFCMALINKWLIYVTRTFWFLVLHKHKTYKSTNKRESFMQVKSDFMVMEKPVIGDVASKF